MLGGIVSFLVSSLVVFIFLLPLGTAASLSFSFSFSFSFSHSHHSRLTLFALFKQFSFSTDFRNSLLNVCYVLCMCMFAFLFESRFFLYS